MPELPEMETYRTLLTEKLAGRAITNVRIGREKSVNVPAAAFVRSVADRTIVSIGRRAKHLLFRLDSGNTLLLHLMLGGWMYYGTERDKPDRTVQVALSFGADTLYFIGLRLGYLHLYAEADLRRQLEGLGPEPLDPGFGAEQFAGVMKRGRGVLKARFMDQHAIAGIGSCYSDEICYAAGIKPVRSTSGLTDAEWLRLHTAMQSVLRSAIRGGGYMEEPLYAGDTLTGGFNDLCEVYDRGDQPCRRCGGTIVRTTVASRKCFYCDNCQS